MALAAPGTADDSSILLGANSIEYAGGTPPNCFGPSVLYDYGNAAIRHTIQQQLAAMAASQRDGIDPRLPRLRQQHLREPLLRSGAVRSTRGTIQNDLTNYLSDIRAAGFRRVTLAFDPRYSADPGHRFGPYDPATFDASWGLIRDARPLLKQSGPSDTRVDVLNEGAPFLPGPDARMDWVRTDVYPLRRCFRRGRRDRLRSHWFERQWSRPDAEHDRQAATEVV